MVRYYYDAWGNHTVSGNSTIGVLNPFRYRSYYYDTETKLYYLQTRYYDPKTCRFLNMASLDFVDSKTVGGLNLYAYCNNNPVMNRAQETFYGSNFNAYFNYYQATNVAPTGVLDAGLFATIVTGLVCGVLIVVGALISYTGVGAPVGTVLTSAGVAGLLGMAGNTFSQWHNKGWDNINWGQVAFNGVTNALIGGIMFSPLGPLAGGIAIGIIGATESVGNDLFDNNFDWNNVEWGKAIITGFAMGAISGAGKLLVNLGNHFAYGFGEAAHYSPQVAAFSSAGKILARISNAITSGVRFGLKALTQLINW